MKVSAILNAISEFRAVYLGCFSDFGNMEISVKGVV